MTIRTNVSIHGATYLTTNGVIKEARNSVELTVHSIDGSQVSVSIYGLPTEIAEILDLTFNPKLTKEAV